MSGIRCFEYSIASFVSNLKASAQYLKPPFTEEIKICNFYASFKEEELHKRVMKTGVVCKIHEMGRVRGGSFKEKRICGKLATSLHKLDQDHKCIWFGTTLFEVYHLLSFHKLLGPSWTTSSNSS